MPKIVDHAARRQQLAEAAWRVIRRDGLEGASARNIAKEAGISLGSLRHYFASQNELFAFSLQMIGERVKERIEKLHSTGDLYADTVAVIEETLPLDEERLYEAIVWFAFMSKTLVDPALGKLAREVHESLFRLFHKLAAAIIRFAPHRSNADVEWEARRLHALVDGLVVHTLTNPESVSPQIIRQTIAYHLQDILSKRS